MPFSTNVPRTVVRRICHIKHTKLSYPHSSESLHTSHPTIQDHTPHIRLLRPSLVTLVMSSQEAVITSKPKPKEKKEKKARSSGGSSGGPKSQTERLKTIVRRLPPNLPEEVFWQSVAKWVSTETVSWRAYYPGKFKTR